MYNLTLLNGVIIDAFAVAICLAIALREARSALHPAWIFMALHVYIVTLRLGGLYMGSHPLKATFEWPVAVSEMIRAGVASDMGLLSMAVGWMAARFILKRRERPRLEVAEVSKWRIRLAAATAMALGVFGALAVHHLEYSRVNTSWDTSGYLAATASWPVWSVCLLHFVYGFRVSLLVVTCVALVFVALTNTARFVVIIPMIFLTLLWLSRRRSRRLPFLLASVILLACTLWLFMKPFTGMLNDGAGAADALSEALRSTYTEFGKDEGSVDQQFLDMVAATMTLADMHGSWYWGGTTIPLFVSPIPRVLWREKPRINQYQWDIQVPSRNMAALGMTAGLVGEGYVDFGYAGVVLYCFVVSFAFAWAYLRIVHSHYLSPARLLYFFSLASASQVYRDGLISAVWFPFVYAAPIGWVAVSHWIWKPRRRRASLPVRRRSEKVLENVG